MSTEYAVHRAERWEWKMLQQYGEGRGGFRRCGGMK